MNVTATCPGSTVAAGGAYDASGTSSGHGALSRVRCHVITSAMDRSSSVAGLKKRSPSQWSEIGKRRFGAKAEATSAAGRVKTEATLPILVASAFTRKQIPRT